MTTGSASQKLSFEFDASGVGTVTTALDRIRAALGDIEVATTRAMSKVAALTTDLNAAAAAAAALKSASGKIDIESPGLAAIARDLAAVSAGLAAVRSGAGPAIGGLDSAASAATTKVSTLSTAIGKLVAAIAGIRSPIDIDVTTTGAPAAESSLSRIATAVTALRSASASIDLRATGAAALSSDLARIATDLTTIRSTGAAAVGSLATALGRAAVRGARVARLLDDIAAALTRVAAVGSAGTIAIRITGDAAAVAALKRVTDAIDKLVISATRLETALVAINAALRSIATTAGSAATAMSAFTSALPPSSAASSISSMAAATGPLASGLSASTSTAGRLRGALLGAARAAAGITIRTGLASLAAGAAAGAGLAVSLRDSADETAKLQRITQSSGFSGGVGQYSAFAAVARKTGIEVDDLSGALSGLTDAYVTALQDPESEQASVFKALGVALRGPNGELLTMSQLIPRVADGLAAMPNSAGRTFALQRITGEDDAIKLLPLLEKGSAGIRKEMEEIYRLGLFVSDNQGKIAVEVDSAWQGLVLSLKSVQRALLEALGPQSAADLQALTAWIAENRAAIVDLAAQGFGFLRSVIVDIFKLLSGSQEPLTNDWLKAFTGVASEIRGIFGEIFKFINGQPSAVPKWISEARATLTKEFKALFDDFVKVYDRDIKPILDAINEIIKYIVGFAGDVSKVFEKIYKPIEAFVEPVLAFLRELTGAENNRQLFILIGLLAPLGGALRAVFAVVSRLWPVIVAIGDALAGVVTVIRTFPLPSLAAIGTALVEGFTGAISTSIIAWKDLFAGFWDWLRTTAADVGRSVGEALSAAGRFLGLSSPATSSTTPSIPGYADGGQVSGPGGPTSDSILARLSTGEFVVRAAAVRQYGVDFLNRVNGLRLPGFATGGFVGAMSMPRMSVPSLAGIGDVGGTGMGAGLTLVLPSGQSVAARTSDAGIRDIKAALQRTARVSSSGSQPAWR
ncbi:hypothetical protein CHU95_20010 [Niveispirillum lacus]|uniref:Bacteriophage tail tape measure C-terminal domain-containing protein n=1 Tax=Niveispirillum lacus TaxID=1981099 RepID=A0A255YQE6_9PROT|nr:hypothetical protein [Niveispirillum lacus]OYQ31438.1 hypothetical protein CHU95_20010 [Niveispirillum lacus]